MLLVAPVGMHLRTDAQRSDISLLHQYLGE